MLISDIIALKRKHCSGAKTAPLIDAVLIAVIDALIKVILVVMKVEIKPEIT